MHHAASYIWFYFVFDAQSFKPCIDPQHNAAFIAVGNAHYFHPFVCKACFPLGVYDVFGGRAVFIFHEFSGGNLHCYIKKAPEFIKRADLSNANGFLNALDFNGGHVSDCSLVDFIG